MEKMEQPQDLGEGPEDPAELCRALLQMTQQLEHNQVVCIYFNKWARREQIIEMMRSRYGEANLRKIEFGLYH